MRRQAARRVSHAVSGSLTAPPGPLARHASFCRIPGQSGNGNRSTEIWSHPRFCSRGNYSDLNRSGDSGSDAVSGSSSSSQLYCF